MASGRTTIFFQWFILLVQLTDNSQRHFGTSFNKNAAGLDTCQPPLQSDSIACTQILYSFNSRNSSSYKIRFIRCNSQLLWWNTLLPNADMLIPETVNDEASVDSDSYKKRNYPRRDYINFENSSTHSALLFVAHRGPVALQDDGTTKLNTGGLITALTSISSLRIISWFALSQTSLEVKYSKESTHSIIMAPPQTDAIRFYPVSAQPSSLQLFYDVICNGVLWFLQHSLSVPESVELNYNLMDAYESGYRTVNKNLADSVLRHVEKVSRPIILLQDYHAYLVAGMIRAVRQDARLLHFIHIPWPTISFWYHIPSRPRSEILLSLLANDVIGFHTVTYCQRFLQCCSYFLNLPVDENRGTVRVDGNREVWVRAYPVPISANITLVSAHSPTVLQHIHRLHQSTAELLVVLVARSDPTKNLDKAFVGFHLFLQQHPEFQKRVSFIAHIVPSRLNITTYQTYLQHAITTAHEINAAFSSSNWTPINIQLRDDREYAMALLRSYDVLLVNSVADGLNLVAKEGSLVNERDGVLILSHTAGVIDELGNHSVNVDPMSEQQLADALYTALTMNNFERKRRSRELQQTVKAKDPEQWLNQQLNDLINKTSQINPKER